MIETLKQAVLSGARAAGLFRLMRARRQQGLLVLTYHSVVDIDASTRRRSPLVYRNAVTAKRFEQELKYLRCHYQLLDHTALQRFLNGESVPKNAVIITFDDGLVNNRTVALPILEKLSVPAVFFLPTAFVTAATNDQQRLHWTEDLIARLSADPSPPWPDVKACLPQINASRFDQSPRRIILALIDHLKSLPQAKRGQRVEQLRTLLDTVDPYRFPADRDGQSVLHTMTWEQAHQAAQRRVTLGSHTVHHEILSQLPPEEARNEIQDSKRHIQEKTGDSVDLFSYPIGRSQDFSAPHFDMLEEAGYSGAFTQLSGINDPATNPFMLRRIPVSKNLSPAEFRYYVSGTKDWVDRSIRRRDDSIS